MGLGLISHHPLVRSGLAFYLAMRLEVSGFFFSDPFETLACVVG